MSTAQLRILSSRAGGALSPPTRASSYGRTAAYRRIASELRHRSELSRQRQPLHITSTASLPLRSHFLPSNLYNNAITTRQVSFKELREERQRQRRAESGPTKAEEAKPKAEPEKAAVPEPDTASEAEAAFAKAKAEGEAQFRAQEKRRAKAEKEAEGEEEGEAKEKKEEEAPERPHGDKTPWQVFTETLGREFKASKEWNQSTKELSGSIHDFTQNPNVQKARSAYSKTAENVTSASGKVIMGTASAIGKSAAWTWDTPVVRGLRQGASVVGSGIEQATRPVRQTEAYKSVKETIDDGASQRYGGWTEKEERKRRREEREARLAAQNPNAPKPGQVFEEDPEAGTNVTLHKDAAWKESWRNFRDSSPIMQRWFGMKSAYQESENPLISTARGISDRVAGFFAENETATVIKKFREMDPSFQLEPFLNEMRTYILPEVLEAYVKGDVETLKLWLSAAQFQVYSALMQQYTTAGLKSDGKILDIRNVEILSARLLDPGDIPVFVLMARTQEVHVYRKKDSGELAAGMEDKVQQVTYAIGVTRLPEEVSNPETRGWRLIEMQKSGRDYI